MDVEESSPQIQVQVFQMMMGGWAAQCLATVARLGIADELGERAMDSDELARAAGANSDSMARLLRAAVATGLMTEDEDHRYHSTPAGDCLRSDVPGSMRNLVIAVLAPGHWKPWGDLYDAVMSGQPTAAATLGCDLWDYYDQNNQELRWFARGMSDVSNVVAMDTVAAYDFSRFDMIVDVGGSQGAMLAAALHAAPAARGVLFDRREVIEAGRTAVAAYGLDDRLDTACGDFFQDVPAGGDLYLLKAIVHDWDDTSAKRILQTVRAAAKSSSTLLIVEMVMPDVVTPEATPVTLMDLNMLVLFGGRERTEGEFRALLGSAGWTLDRVAPTRGMGWLLEATCSV
jgi:O-methyltransferase domain/Dimerisation domain